MNKLANCPVRELNSTELLKVEGGSALILVSKKILRAAAFGAGFVVGFVDEMAS